MEASQKVWIASHRGRFGGNIVENTLPAFEAALRCGADIVEMDVRKTKDQVMILFHDESPQRLLGLPGNVSDYTLAELRAKPLLNVIGLPSGLHVATLTEALRALKGRCMLNLDQCWGYMDEVYALLEKEGMAEQALIKGRAPYDEAIAWLRQWHWQPQYIPVLTTDEDIPAYEALPSSLRVPMVEVFLKHDADRLISPAFVAGVQARGARLWLNALALGEGITLSAWHDDTRSLTVSPEEGWGWLMRHGASVIQTDWPRELRTYLDSIGR